MRGKYSFVVHSSTKAREAFCYDFAHMSTEMKLEGDVAELGVFRGRII